MLALSLLLAVGDCTTSRATLLASSNSYSRYMYYSDVLELSTSEADTIIYIKSIPRSTVEVFTLPYFGTTTTTQVDSFETSRSTIRAFHFNNKYGMIRIKSDSYGQVEIVYVTLSPSQRCDEVSISTKEYQTVDFPNTTMRVSSIKSYCVALMRDTPYSAYVVNYASVYGNLYKVFGSSKYLIPSFSSTESRATPLLLSFEPTTSLTISKSNGFSATIQYVSTWSYDTHIVGTFKQGQSGYSSLDAKGVSRTGSSDSDPLSPGAIIGIVMGVLFFLFIICIIVACCCCKRVKVKKESSSSSSSKNNKKGYPQQLYTGYPPQGQAYSPQQVQMYPPQPSPYQQPGQMYAVPQGQVYSPPAQVVANPYNQPAGYYPPPPPPSSAEQPPYYQ